MSFLSVIIPVYGCEKYLRECVSSILVQKEKMACEILLIDDGSLDTSGVIADELAEKYPSVRTYHKSNGGAASARNVGIQKACGDYVLFVDGDDTIDKNTVKYIQEALEYNPEMVVFGMSFDYYYKESIQRREVLSCKHLGQFKKDDVLNQYEDMFYDNAFSSACNKVFRKDIIEKNQLLFNENMTLYEDYDFVLQYMKYTNSLYFIGEPLYYYRHDIEHPHVRVLELEKLKENQSHLLSTVIHTTKDENCAGVFEVTCNTYMDLLVQHLMNKDYSLKELEKVLPKYIDEEHFESMLPVITLSEFNQSLLNDIKAGNYSKIRNEFRKRKLIRKGKQRIKQVLRKVKQ